MRQKEPWYLGQRAEALALALFTARDDLRVAQSQKDSGLDFRVEL
ncbi:MAG: hypothetical protein K0Q72_5240, partial [Armatimonadetes bacterium]|nr:hypothetical protein [Armatimonadota bacterium]